MDQGQCLGSYCSELFRLLLHLRKLGRHLQRQGQLSRNLILTSARMASWHCCGSCSLITGSHWVVHRVKGCINESGKLSNGRWRLKATWQEADPDQTLSHAKLQIITHVCDSQQLSTAALRQNADLLHCNTAAAIIWLSLLFHPWFLCTQQAVHLTCHC